MLFRSAEVPNPDGLLLPGMFVKVRLAQATAQQALRVPQQAVTRGGNQGDTVLVLGPDNKPAPRQVTLGAALGSDWLVLQGLADGERVVVDGFQRMRPNTPVTPVPWVPPSSSLAPQAAPAQAAVAASTTAAAASR